MDAEEELVETSSKQGTRNQPGGRPRDQRADPLLKSMLLGLIEDSYVHTGSFTQFAAEILKVLAYAATVPVAFTEGFLRAYLSIDRVEETLEGRIKIVPKTGASVEAMISDVDEIMAQVDPGAVFNPIVRSKLTAVHETSSKAMKYDIDHLARMNDEQLMEVLKEMQAESERVKGEEPGDDPSTDYLRAKLATIRKNVRQFQAQQQTGPEVVGGEKDAQAIGEMLTEQPGESPITLEQSPPAATVPPFESI